MKISILITTILIGLYVLVRNNVGKLPGQIIWVGHPDIFYKEFIPLLMVVSSGHALIRYSNNNFYLLAILALLIDAINRVSVVINRFADYLIYGINPFLEKIYVGNEFAKEQLFWPAYIIFGIEVVLLIIVFKTLSGLMLSRASSP